MTCSPCGISVYSSSSSAAAEAGDLAAAVVGPGRLRLGQVDGGGLRLHQRGQSRTR